MNDSSHEVRGKSVCGIQFHDRSVKNVFFCVLELDVVFVDCS